MGFDSIAKKAPATKGKSVKVAATVTNEVKDAVDVVIANKAAVKKLEAETAEAEATIIDHVLPQYVEHARNGNFTKSLTVEGNTDDVLLVTSDRFSVPKDEDSLAELAKLVGKKFDAWFPTERTIAVRKNINPAKIAEIEKIFEKAGKDVADYFEVTDVQKAVSGMDEKQFELAEPKRLILQTLAPQAKPAIKC